MNKRMMKNRFLSALLVLCVCFSLLPAAVFAVDAADTEEDLNLCKHHPKHTEECGYVKGESECKFVCEDKECVEAKKKAKEEAEAKKAEEEAKAKEEKAKAEEKAKKEAAEKAEAEAKAAEEAAKAEAEAKAAEEAAKAEAEAKAEEEARAAEAAETAAVANESEDGDNSGDNDGQNSTDNQNSDRGDADNDPAPEDSAENAGGDETEATAAPDPIEVSLLKYIQITVNGDPVAETDIENQFEIKITENGEAVENQQTYEQAGTHEYTVSVKAEDDAYQIEKAEQTLAVKAEAGEEDGKSVLKVTSDPEKLTFAFTKEEQKPTFEEVPLSGKVTVDGGKPAIGVKFKVELKSEDDTVNAPQEVKTNTKGEFEFTNLSYTEEGTYHYSVAQKTDEKYTYDTTVYNIAVTVAAAGVTKVVTKNDGTELKEGEEIVFNNAAKPTTEPVPFDPAVSVKVNGETPNKNQNIFTFELSGDAMEKVQTVTNKGETVPFETVSLDQAGTYKFTVKQTTDEKPFYILDEKEYDITVVVEEDDKGTLAITQQTYENSEGKVVKLDENPIVFDNEFFGQLTVKATKTISGSDPGVSASGKFTFTLTGDDGESQSVKNGGLTGGDVVFDPIVFEESDLGKEHTYTIKETPVDGYTCDSSVYTVKAALTEDGMETTVQKDGVTIEGEDALSKITFNNKMPSGKFRLTKTVTGNGASQSEEFTFKTTLTKADGTPFANATITASDGSRERLDENGSFTRKLKHGESYELGGVPLGTKFTVQELNATDYTTTVNGTEGKTYSGTMQSTAGALVSFINKKNDPVELTISKTVTGTGASKSRPFTFKVTLSDAKNEYSYTGSKSGKIRSGGTVQLKHGESITIKGLPSNTSYAISETSVTGYTASYQTTTTPSTGNATAGNVTQRRIATGSFAQGDKSDAVAFTNKYTSSVRDTYGKKPTNTNTANKTKSVNTGDSNNMGLWIALFVAAGAGLIALFVVRRRQRG